jgi:hypothetical protein
MADGASFENGPSETFYGLSKTGISLNPIFRRSLDTLTSDLKLAID